MPPRARERPPLTEAQRKLVLEHRELVVDVASHVRPSLPSTITFDELISAGLEGLMDAARRYDAAVGSTFPMFAYTRVKGAMYDYARKAGAYKASAVEAHKAQQDLEDRRARGEVATETFHRLVAELTGARPIHVVSMEAASEVPAAGASPETAVHNSRRLERIARALEDLRTEEREIVRMVHLEGRTLEDAGKQKGWSKSWTSRIHSSAMTFLRTLLDGVD